jgi:predicted dehydrogenase
MTFMNFPSLLPLDYTPKLPSNPDYGIGLVGAGQIVNQAHLPAYRKAGFRVLAITDQNRSAAEATARRFEIPRVCNSVEDLLGVAGIEIVDIAVPARHNPELSKQVMQGGKHVLVQKPMAETALEAEEMVNEARAAKRKLAVNQQMRWAPSIRAASDLLRRGFFGELAECTIQIQIRTAWNAWPWLQTHPYPELYYHSIHHLDAMRSWLGDPIALYATLARYPGSNCVGPTRNYMLFEYPGNLRASMLVNHHSVAPDDDLSAKFTIEGTEGRCEGLIGLLLSYPTGRSDLLTVSHGELAPSSSLRLELCGRWFPDAFIGPMSSLMDAITNDTEPETSGGKILGTLRMIEAIRKSHETRQAITL